MKSGWVIKKLGEVCEEVKDRTSSIGVVLSAYITTDNMLKDCAGVCEAENLPPKVTSLVKYRKGDVLLSNIRPYLKKVWLADRDGGASSDVIVFRACSKEIHPRYIWQALARDEFFNYSMLNVSGTKMPRGKREWMKQFEIPIPPLPEQKRIVAKIDAAFEKIDKLKANAERNLKNAKELFQSALEEAMRPKKGWVEKRLVEVCEILDSKRKPITKKDRVAGPIPYYGATSVQDHVRNYIFDEPLVLLGEDGAKWGAGDKSAYMIEGKSWVNNHAHVLRPMPSLLRPWLTYYLVASDLSEFISGTTVPKLNQERMRSIPIPMPPVSEQQLVVKRLDFLAEKTKLLEQNYARQIAYCAEMRQSVLREAFEGRL